MGLHGTVRRRHPTGYGRREVRHAAGNVNVTEYSRSARPFLERAAGGRFA
jgi:hypothetical protein